MADASAADLSLKENPLISWRLNRIDKMVEAASDEPGAECTVAQADQIRAYLRDARPAFEADVGVNYEGVDAIRAFVKGSHGLSVASRIHIADLAISYITVQMMHFAYQKTQRKLTPEENQFGGFTLMSLVNQAYALVRAR